jgi:outer membrane protein
MNHLRIAALVLCVATLPSAATAQAPPDKLVTQYVVVLNFNEAVLRTSEAQKALTALQAQFTPRQSQLQALNDEVETLRKQMESTNDKVSESERATRVQTLDKKEKQLQRQVEDFKTDSQTESQQVFQRVAQKVFSFLQTYAPQHGYSAVIERGSDASPVVWYAASNMDITGQLIKAYDGQSGATSQQSPAGPTNRELAKPPVPLPDNPPHHP